MRANRGLSPPFAPRDTPPVPAALLVLGLVGFGPTAGADLPHDLQQAKARLAQLKREIDAQKQVLSSLESKAAVIAQRYLDAKAEYDRITAALAQTRVQLARATDQYRAVRAQLNDRIRQAYMQGPGSPLEFVLGASSMTDLADRMEYVNAISQSDAALTNQVQNLRNQLGEKAHDLTVLQTEQADKLEQVRTDQAQVAAQLARGKEIYGRIRAKEHQAEQLVHKYQKQLAALYRLTFNPNGVFKVCPVGQPHIVTDGFGAPRYSGGFHYHMGNDIMAPVGTPIYAPFDGTASSSYDLLGGNAEFVYGASGYVYNAHLSGYSANSNGPVLAGEVIGYVGDTGDAVGGPAHDHFEWHPNVFPSSWPASPYGFSTIDGALNPYPLLEQVC
jgi:peptidoglycan hydrolase CwlO-like protein